MLFALNGKVAVVTGAGSLRGIGRSIAIALATQGAKVAICNINEEGAAQGSRGDKAKDIRGYDRNNECHGWNLYPGGICVCG